MSDSTKDQIRRALAQSNPVAMQTALTETEGKSPKNRGSAHGLRSIVDQKSGVSPSSKRPGLTAYILLNLFLFSYTYYRSFQTNNCSFCCPL